MKKFFATLLIIVYCLSVCACGANNATQENISGVYNNITFSPDSSFTLNENSTYDRVSPNEKGTYKSSSKGGFTLIDANYNDETVFAKKDTYYYRTNLICCFEEDEEYGLAPTFSDNGTSNQWFSAYYESITDSKWNVIILELKEDSTFKLRDCTRDVNGNQSDGTVYEGTYSLNDYVLNLNCNDGQNFTFLFIDDKIYFDVYVKQ